MTYDKIIIGAGLYGLYSAELCGREVEKVLVLEYDQVPFMRATYKTSAVPGKPPKKSLFLSNVYICKYKNVEI